MAYHFGGSSQVLVAESPSGAQRLFSPEASEIVVGAHESEMR